MNGLEMSRAFFEEYGRPMLEEQFPQVLPYLAVGLLIIPAWGLPVGETPLFQCRAPGVRSLVRELDPTCHIYEFTCCN